jgi:hypothetical protein
LESENNTTKSSLQIKAITMITNTILFVILLLSLYMMTLVSSLTSIQDASLNQQKMLSRRRIGETTRMVGTGNTNSRAVDNDDSEDDEDDQGDGGDDTEADVVEDDYGSDNSMIDDTVSYDKDCTAIASGSPISTEEYDHQVTYQIDLALEIDGDVTETLARLEEFLQMHIATDLAGCNKNDGTSASPKVDIQYVLFDVEEDSESSKYLDDVSW